MKRDMRTKASNSALNAKILENSSNTWKFKLLLEREKNYSDQVISVTNFRNVKIKIIDKVKGVIKISCSSRNCAKS